MIVTRRRATLAMKTLLGLLVVGGVAWHLGKLLADNPPQSGAVSPRYGYLAAAGVLYLACHTIWGTFFYQLLCKQGSSVGWLTVIRAYFISQAGKYVPGKAWVLLLRVVILRRTGLTTTAIGVAGIYETLTSMAAGAMIGALLLPWSGLVFADGSMQRYAIFGVAGLPVGAILLNRLALRVARRFRGPDQAIIPKPPFWLLVRGLLQASVGWLLLGASLHLTVIGLSDVALPLTADGSAGLVVANAIAYISGFVAIILPGGLGVREELLQRMLSVQLRPTLGDSATGFAVVTAFALRLVWTLFEAAFSVLLWWAGRVKSPSQAAASVVSTGTLTGATHG